MLNRDPKARITARDALKNCWIMKYETSEVSKKEQDENLIQSLRNLKNFETECTLQKAVLSYIASQEIDPVTEKKFRQVFDALDTDKSGQVSVSELVQGYERIYKDKVRARRASAQVLKRTDVNKNGYVDYNGMEPVRSHDRVPDGEPEEEPGIGGRGAETGVRLLRRGMQNVVTSIGQERGDHDRGAATSLWLV
ncbi:MAG: EF-hand domain-containing protein [Candidatus Pacebacteria bacterium]|nr:EF-hand domain-containing protein [Candidatus Paceibacterota bacterium]